MLYITSSSLYHHYKYTGFPMDHFHADVWDSALFWNIKPGIENHDIHYNHIPEQTALSD